MALIKCDECNAQISDTAASCPHCGAKPRPKTSGSTKFWGTIFALIVAVAVFSPDRDKSAPADTPEQIAAREADNLRFNKTLHVVKTIKASLRDPDSAKWEGITANDDASIICVEYRARNGFGGMNLEHVTISGGKVSQQVADWNKVCAGKPMNDMKKVRHAL